MNLNKRQLVKIVLAIVISAALAVASVYLIVNLGQAVLHWFDSLAPRSRTWVTLGLLLVALGSAAYGVWRMRCKRRQ